MFGKFFIVINKLLNKYETDKRIKNPKNQMAEYNFQKRDNLKKEIFFTGKKLHLFSLIFPFSLMYF